MKRKITLILVAFSTYAHAQLDIPRPSSKASVNQKIGYTELQIDYNRPAKKGRKIFGDLVPFGEKWRTGADANTIFSTSQPIEIGGKTLPSGKYALYAEPHQKVWTIYFYNKLDSWGLPDKWNEADVVLKLQVKPFEYKHDTEFFTIEIHPVGMADGEIELRWEKTAVRIPFHTHTIEATLQNIDQNLGEQSTNFDYYDAALFLLNAERDYTKALSYIDKSIEKEGKEMHYSLWLKARILDKLGRRKEAIQHAEASLKKSQQIGNKSYIRLNNKLLQEWKK